MASGRIQPVVPPGIWSAVGSLGCSRPSSLVFTVLINVAPPTDPSTPYPSVRPRTICDVVLTLDACVFRLSHVCPDIRAMPSPHRLRHPTLYSSALRMRTSCSPAAYSPTALPSGLLSIELKGKLHGYRAQHPVAQLDLSPRHGKGRKDGFILSCVSEEARRHRLGAVRRRKSFWLRWMCGSGSSAGRCLFPHVLMSCVQQVSSPSPPALQ